MTEHLYEVITDGGNRLLLSASKTTIDQESLVLLDSKGVRVAVFAPGEWSGFFMVELDPDAPRGYRPVALVKMDQLEPKAPPVPVNSKLFESVDELELSVRSCNVLQSEGIQLVGELVLLDSATALKFKNAGRRTIRELGEVLEAKGLAMGMELNEVDKLALRKEITQRRALHIWEEQRLS